MEGTVNITISQLDNMRNEIKNQNEVIEELKKAKSNNIVYFKEESYSSMGWTNNFKVSTDNEFLKIYNKHLETLNSQVSDLKNTERELSMGLRNLKK